MPTEFGDFRALAYRSTLDGTEHLALVMGDLAAASRASGGALVRVHSECLAGDIIGSLRCDCGGQLEQALTAVAAEGVGAVVYLRGHEGRGIGLGHKIRAYALQEEGLDTVDANTALGLPVDSRSYGVGAQILADLGATRIRLITNNPAKYRGLDGHGLTVVGRVGLPVVETVHNIRYLRTKRERMGHELDGERPGLTRRGEPSGMMGFSFKRGNRLAGTSTGTWAAPVASTGQEQSRPGADSVLEGDSIPSGHWTGAEFVLLRTLWKAWNARRSASGRVWR